MKHMWFSCKMSFLFTALQLRCSLLGSCSEVLSVNSKMEISRSFLYSFMHSLVTACLYVCMRGIVFLKSEDETVVIQRCIRCIWVAFFFFLLYPIYLGFPANFFFIQISYSYVHIQHYLMRVGFFCSFEGLVVIAICTHDFIWRRGQHISPFIRFREYHAQFSPHVQLPACLVSSVCTVNNYWEDERKLPSWLTFKCLWRGACGLPPTKQQLGWFTW